MSRYQHQSIPPPRGMNISADPSKLQQDEAQYIARFYPSRHGVLELCPSLENGTNIGNGTTIQGIAYYRYGDASETYDRIVAVGSDNNVYMATPTFYELSGVVYLSISNPFTLVGPVGYTWTGNVRAVQFKDELIMCPSGVGRPIRFYLHSVVGPVYRVRNCGFDTTPSYVTTPTISSVAGGAKVGTFMYAITLEDNKGRESDLIFTNPTTITLPSGVNQTARISVTWPSDPQTVAVNVYVSLNGNLDNLYRIHRNTSGANFTYDDSVADINIPTGTVAERPGVNARPPDCANLAVWKNRVIYCTAANIASPITAFPGEGAIQISNEGSPTQCSVAGDVGYPTDGIALNIGAKSYNVAGCCAYGSILLAYTPEGCWAVTGDNSDTFQVQPIHQKGCIAGDSIVRCNDTVVWLSHDGWYAGGTSAQKISAPLDAAMSDKYWSGISIERCKTDAVAFFWDNRYFCSLGSKTFCYDFQSGGWSDVGYWAIYSVAMVQQDRTGTYNPSLGIKPNRPVIPLIVPDATPRQYASTMPTGVFTPALPDSVTATATSPPYSSINPYVILRFPDGGEIPRNRVKRLKRLTVWGETIRDYIQDVRIIVTSETGSSWTYYGTFGVKTYTLGALWVQEFTPDVVGRTFTIKIEWVNDVVSPIRFRDFLIEYIPLN